MLESADYSSTGEIVSTLNIERYFSTKYDNVKWIAGGMLLFNNGDGLSDGGIYGGIHLRSTGKILAFTSSFALGAFPLYYEGDFDYAAGYYTQQPVSSNVGGFMSFGIMLHLGKYISIHPQVTIMLVGTLQPEPYFFIYGFKIPLTITF